MISKQERKSSSKKTITVKTRVDSGRLYRISHNYREIYQASWRRRVNPSKEHCLLIKLINFNNTSITHSKKRMTNFIVSMENGN